MKEIKEEVTLMPQQTIRKFLSGEMDIVDFRHIYDTDPAIDAFL